MYISQCAAITSRVAAFLSVHNFTACATPSGETINSEGNRLSEQFPAQGFLTTSWD